MRRRLRERRVPSSPIGRVFGFAQLGASLVYGTMSDSVSQYFRGSGGGEGGAAGPKANTTGNRQAPACGPVTLPRVAEVPCLLQGPTVVKQPPCNGGASVAALLYAAWPERDTP